MTEFVTPGSLYQYTFLPFGVHGPPATFQRMMDQLLRPHQAYAAAYIDDIIIHSASWDPEALPLRAATAKAVAKELMLLFSRVGIAREVLTDQGTCFMSRVMKELLSLLQVKQLRTSVYHPQTDRLVERFNKTLKQMLKKAMDTDGKNWD